MLVRLTPICGVGTAGTAVGLNALAPTFLRIVPFCQRSPSPHSCLCGP